jgi:hypothetical protein
MRFRRDEKRMKYDAVVHSYDSLDTAGLRASTLAELPSYAVWCRSTLAELPGYAVWLRSTLAELPRYAV